MTPVPVHHRLSILYEKKWNIENHLFGFILEMSSNTCMKFYSKNSYETRHLIMHYKFKTIFQMLLNDGKNKIKFNVKSHF